MKIPEIKEKNKGWNPYVAGIWLGLLAIASVYLTTTLLNKSTYLGASTTFVRAAGFLFQTIDPEHVAENVYYAKEKIFSILGGIVAMIGARLADGCPSGHGLSGMMQLSLSSFFAMAMFFGFGILVANFIYKKL